MRRLDRESKHEYSRKSPLLTLMLRRTRMTLMLMLMLMIPGRKYLKSNCCRVNYHWRAEAAGVENIYMRNGLERSGATNQLLRNIYLRNGHKYFVGGARVRNGYNSCVAVGTCGVRFWNKLLLTFQFRILGQKFSQTGKEGRFSCSAPI